MEYSNNLSLPYIMPSQAQKHVTHNEAIRSLDSLVMPSVQSHTLTEPPANINAGECFIAGTNATGEWTGKDKFLAAWQDSSWHFFEPGEGWVVWSVEAQGLIVFNNGEWSDLTQSQNESLEIERLGINVAADNSNRVSVSANATLLSHEGSSHRLYINKQQSNETASIVFQNDFQGHAEIGLTGDDDLAFKVSADGANFSNALKIDRSSGKVEFPNSGYLEDFSCNLFQDSGRMAGSNVTSIQIASFNFPDYLHLANGSNAVAHGKFIHNNTDNGGSAGAMVPAVSELTDKIRDPGIYRRYGNEYWVAEISMGTQTGSSFSHSGTTGKLALSTKQSLRPAKMTFHAYLRAMDQSVIIRRLQDARLFLDGQEQTDSVLLDPAYGWASIRIEDDIDPRNSTGYSPSILYLYAQSAGDKILIACPALLPGRARIDPNSGIIANINSWSV